MAKIKFGMMLTDARGKLGGQVFSKNRSGAYVRTKVTPTNPQTSYQTAVRTLFALFSQAWSSLTDEIRAGWNGAVTNWSTTDIFGDIKNPTGKNLFLKLNQNAVNAGYPQIFEAPSKLEMVEGIVSNVDVSNSAPSVTLAGVYEGLDAKVVVSATASLSQGTSFVKNKLRDIYSATGNDLDSEDLYNYYVSKYAAPAVGANVYFGIRYVLPNGQVSPVQIVKAKVVA